MAKTSLKDMTAEEKRKATQRVILGVIQITHELASVEGFTTEQKAAAISIVIEAAADKIISGLTQ